MNRILQFAILIFWCSILYAQNIVVDGVTFSADKKTLIKYPKVKPGREYVIPEGTEVVGKKAFSEIGLEEVTFPTTLTHINDSAFYRGPSHFIITGKFPIIGNRVWDETRYFEVSEDNLYCYVSDVNGIVYSKDKKVLHVAPVGNIGYLENIEIIDRYAFQDCVFRYGYVYIPDNVRIIREHAFDNIQPTSPTRSELSYYQFNFDCYASTPPELEGKVFDKNNVGCSTLYVPEESEALYKAAPQWNTFGTIEGYTPRPPQGISENSVSALKINRMDDIINIEAFKPIEVVRLISSGGSVVFEQRSIDSCCASCHISSIDRFIGLLQIVYQDGSSYAVKFKF